MPYRRSKPRIVTSSAVVSRVRMLAAQGLNQAEIAQEIGSCQGYVSKLQRAWEIPHLSMTEATTSARWRRSRRARVVAAIHKGVDTIDALAAALGASHEQISDDIKHLRRKGLLKFKKFVPGLPGKQWLSAWSVTDVALKRMASERSAALSIAAE